MLAAAPATSSASAPGKVLDVASWRFRQEYGRRILTDSVYRPRPRSTYSLLLAQRPTFTQRPYRYHQQLAGLAPHPKELEALSAGELTWEAFAAQYWRRLQLFPSVLTQFRRQVATLLERYPQVALLGLELVSRWDEPEVRCHRRLVRAWLLGESVLEVAH